MDKISDEELDMLIDLNQDKYCQNHYDFTVQKAANELKELREFKAIYQKGMDYSYATFMYNKAIDDLTNKLTSDEFQKYNLDFVFETSKSLSYNECISAFCEYIEKIANELKEHKKLNIVHCKDCKHWGTGVAGETENIKCCSYGKYMVGANGYCVYGEKKECAENE